MNRILLTGTALLTLLNAGMPANAAHMGATRHQQAPIQRQWFGSGAYVEGVDANSPAERAGLRPGDYIVAINGSPINNQSDVDPFVAGGGGRPLTLDVRRGGTILRFRATPRFGLAPTPYGGVERRRMLGYSYTVFGFGFGHGDAPIFDPNTIPPIPPDPPTFTPPPITN
jgi:membrane-associated protease RseP (regulator of RpoE activity)